MTISPRYCPKNVKHFYPLNPWNMVQFYQTGPFLIVVRKWPKNDQSPTSLLKEKKDAILEPLVEIRNATRHGGRQTALDTEPTGVNMFWQKTDWNFPFGEGHLRNIGISTNFSPSFPCVHLWEHVYILLQLAGPKHTHALSPQALTASPYTLCLTACWSWLEQSAEPTELRHTTVSAPQLLDGEGAGMPEGATMTFRSWAAAAAPSFDCEGFPRLSADGGAFFSEARRLGLPVDAR